MMQVQKLGDDLYSFTINLDGIQRVADAFEAKNTANFDWSDRDAALMNAFNKAVSHFSEDTE